MDKITLREKFFYFFFDKKGWIPLMVLALFFFLLKAAPTVMTILILSFFIAYAIEPLVNFFSSKVKLPRAIMTAFVLFLLVLALMLLGLIIVPGIIEQLMRFDWSASIASLWDWINSQAARFDIDLQQYYKKEELLSIVESHGKEIFSSASSVVGSLVEQTFSLASLALDLLILVVVTFFISSRYSEMKAKIAQFIPPNKKKSVDFWLDKIDRVLAGFIRGQLIVCFILGSLYALGLTIAGIENAFSLGMMIGILCFVPYVGLFTGISVTLVLAALTSGAFAALKVLIVFTIIQICDTIFITPNIVGKKVGMHPVLVIIAIFGSAEIGGILGVLTAVPTFAIICLVASEIAKKYKDSEFFKGESLVPERKEEITGERDS